MLVRSLSPGGSSSAGAKALLFYLIDRFVRDGRLANLLKILVGLICLAAILQRLLPALGVSGLL